MWSEEGDRNRELCCFGGWTRSRDDRRMGRRSKLQKRVKIFYGTERGKRKYIYVHDWRQWLSEATFLQLGTKLSDAIICSFCFTNYAPYAFK